MKKILGLLLFVVIIFGCATTSTSNIQQGKESELLQTKTVVVGQFQCDNEAIAQAVKNTIIEVLIPTGIKIVTNNDSADVIIQGTITLTYDAVSSGGAFVGQNAGSSYESGTAGSYVSGITVQIIKDDEIIAAASETQVRTDLWLPDPPEVMARKIGENIKEMFGRQI